MNVEVLIELDRLRPGNKKEWIMSHMLGFIEHENMTNLLSNLTQRRYELEKTIFSLITSIFSQYPCQVVDRF